MSTSTFAYVLRCRRKGHRPYADQLRAEFLDVIRFTEAEVLAPTFIADLKRRLREVMD